MNLILSQKYSFMKKNHTFKNYLFKIIPSILMKKKLPLLLQSIALTAVANIHEQETNNFVEANNGISGEFSLHSSNLLSAVRKPGFILKRIDNVTGGYEGNFHRSHRSHSSHRSHYSSYGGSSGSSSYSSGSSSRSSSSSSGSNTNSSSNTPQYNLGDRSLRFGDEGTDVIELKKHLRKLGYDISISSVVENFFNSQTELAVRQFQQKNNLKIDGIVTPNVLMYLKSTESSIENLSIRTLSWGNTGQDVLEVKKILVKKKILKQKEGETLNDRFDDSTEAAIKAFQSSKGLPQTGTIDRSLLQVILQL